MEQKIYLEEHEIETLEIVQEVFDLIYKDQPAKYDFSDLLDQKRILLGELRYISRILLGEFDIHEKENSIFPITKAEEKISIMGKDEIFRMLAYLCAPWKEGLHKKYGKAWDILNEVAETDNISGRELIDISRLSHALERIIDIKDFDSAIRFEAKGLRSELKRYQHYAMEEDLDSKMTTRFKDLNKRVMALLDEANKVYNLKEKPDSVSVEILLPQDWNDNKITQKVLDFCLTVDQAYRAIGGSGLKVDVEYSDVNIFELIEC